MPCTYPKRRGAKSLDKGPAMVTQVETEKKRKDKKVRRRGGSCRVNRRKIKSVFCENREES